MPLYLYDWKDGEVSLVQAANKDAANIDVLDAHLGRRKWNRSDR